MKRKEIIIFAAILVVAVAVLLIMIYSNKDNDKCLLVTVDGIEYKNILLTENTNMSFTIHTHEGINEVIITGGHVDVVSADCPSQVCVHTKQASEINDMIICLPHKVIIEIVGADKEVK